MSSGVEIRDDPFPDRDAYDALCRAAWGSAPDADIAPVLARSLAHVGAFTDGRLIAFVNVAWDGGQHASVFDTCVHPDFRRRGIATAIVKRAVELARERGANWLHVDYEPHLAAFYEACGFRPTAAGLVRLR